MVGKGLFITGGAGFLGRAIIADAERRELPVTIYSRDPVKHQAVTARWPWVNTILGDVRDTERLSAAMAGHDLVIHAAAQKHIPQGEINPGACIADNIDGSRSVITAARAARVSRVVGVSTDKVCYPINVYGITKLAMERLFTEAAEAPGPAFTCIRYGNVIGSTAAFLSQWRVSAEASGVIQATDPDMIRFWLTGAQAVDWVMFALGFDSGAVIVPKLPVMGMADILHTVAPGVAVNYNGLRPGEKRYEALMTDEEALRSTDLKDCFAIWPAPKGRTRLDEPRGYYSNTTNRMLTPSQFLAMIDGLIIRGKR